MSEKLQGITLLVDHDRGGSVLTDRRTSSYGTPNRAENDARRDLTRAKEEVLIRRVLGGDKDSFLSQPGWKPTLPAKTPGTFFMTDLLQFVGDISPIDGITTVGTL